jgi:hypothetical protein
MGVDVAVVRPQVANLPGSPFQHLVYAVQAQARRTPVAPKGLFPPGLVGCCPARLTGHWLYSGGFMGTYLPLFDVYALDQEPQDKYNLSNKRKFAHGHGNVGEEKEQGEIHQVA